MKLTEFNIKSLSVIFSEILLYFNEMTNKQINKINMIIIRIYFIIVDIKLTYYITY